MYLDGNASEWGRIYIILKMISEKGCFKGNTSFKINEKSSPLKLIRFERDNNMSISSFSFSESGALICREEPKESKESVGSGSYTQDFNPEDYGMVVSENVEESFETVIESKESIIEIDEIKNVCEQLLNLIKKNKDGNFSDEATESLLERMFIYDFYSPSLTGEDLRAVFYDNDIQCERYFPVRLKPTFSNLYLIESNRASNFKYDIIDVKLSNPEANKINYLGDTETGSLIRLQEIFRLGGKLKFTSVEGKFFQSALQLIDMNMPRLTSEAIKLFYTSDAVSVSSICDKINRINPFKVKDEMIEKSRVYEYKFRQLLYHAATGLKPTKTWKGNGNMHLQIFTGKNGELLAYDPSNKEQFEKFLFHNTRFCLANEEKNKFGQVEKENGQWLFKLNLEIRFI